MLSKAVCAFWESQGLTNSGEASDYIEFCTCALLSHWFGHIVLLGYNKINFKAGM